MHKVFSLIWPVMSIFALQMLCIIHFYLDTSTHRHVISLSANLDRVGEKPLGFLLSLTSLQHSRLKEHQSHGNING